MVPPEIVVTAELFLAYTPIPLFTETSIRPAVILKVPSL